MFHVSTDDINSILRDYGVYAKPACITELLRYHYEDYDPSSKEVRLILKVELDDGVPLVIKLKNENDINPDIVNSQCAFSEQLAVHGLPVARYDSNGAHYVTSYHINDHDVLVTVEEFKQCEIHTVDEIIAEKTGRLLAKAHNIAEENDYHVDYPVLFDPFVENDLFTVDQFKSTGKYLSGDNLKIYHSILKTYAYHREMIAPLEAQKRYAVQGDISSNNLFMAENGEVGMFDFNRCGDNNLFCDAIMQAVFESRLMDYPATAADDFEHQLFRAFLFGYNGSRPFTEQQMPLIPHLYAMITTFWRMQIVFNEDSLLKSIASENWARVSEILKEMERQIQYKIKIDI